MMNLKLLKKGQTYLCLCLLSLFLTPPAFAHEGEEKGNKQEEPYTPPRDRKKLNVQLPYVEGLPNVLIIGDSISIGYTPHVMLALKGKANVSRIPKNGGDTQRGLDNLDKWLGKKKWDVIHFNWGLHDLCYRHPDSKVQGKRDKKNGTQQIPIEQYTKNLEQLVEKLKATDAKLIWASITFVPEGEAGRFQGDDHKYNAAAAAIMKKHGVAINDLNAFSQTIQEHASKPGDVHFTNEGSKKLGQQVAQEIKKQIKPESTN